MLTTTKPPAAKIIINIYRHLHNSTALCEWRCPYAVFPFLYAPGEASGYAGLTGFTRVIKWMLITLMNISTPKIRRTNCDRNVKNAAMFFKRFSLIFPTPRRM